MKKNILIILLSILVSACGTATIPTATATIPAAIPTSAPTQPVNPCSAISVEPTPGPEMPSLFPKVDPNEHISGPADAAVTIIEYADFQCPTCNQLARILAYLLEQYPGDLRLVFRHLPLVGIHDKAFAAAQASEAATVQGKFWEMHGLLYGRYNDWVLLSPDEFDTWLFQQVNQLGLDLAAFQADYASETIRERLMDELYYNSTIGLIQTPFLLVNGQMYFGPMDYNSMNQLISLIILGERQFNVCPPMTIDPLKQYIARLYTEKGEIVIQLYADKAPITVNSFVFLARNGWYDDITFHRVIPGSYAQTGDPSGTGLGNAGYFTIDEFDPSLKYDRPGVVGMYNPGGGTNGGQFFIAYAAQPHFDGAFTIFGQVLSGMDVLSELAPRDPQPGITLEPGEKLIRVTIEEK